MTTWNEIFAPVVAQGRESRAGQIKLGQSIIDVIEDGGSLLGEASTGTGKSFATLVPMIHAVQQAKEKRKPFKCVVSTETITLQSQLINKDLPFLSTLYENFTFSKLMGRSNYLCFDSAKLMARGNNKLHSLVSKLEAKKSAIINGELSDIERILKRELEKEEWAQLVGSSKFCADNQCDPENCYSSLARKHAMSSDIVVVNHAILATDIEMKMSSGGGPFADGMLGPIDVLAVDEGHKLEEVLVSQWTKKFSDWELQEKQASVIDGIEKAKAVKSNETLMHSTVQAMDDLQDMLNNIQNFYGKLINRQGGEWKGSESALCEKTISGSVSPDLMAAMEEYEYENPKRLINAQHALVRATKFLTHASELAAEEGLKGLRKINKGLRASKDLFEILQIMEKALATKDGIVQQYGTFGAIMDGWERRNGEKEMTIRLIPLDVSHRAKFIWSGVRSNILISATLTDLTEGTFRYVRESLAFPEGKEVKVDTPFDYQSQQLVYVTPANTEQFEDTKFSLTELTSLVNASGGRALILFTSRKELDACADALWQLRNEGQFPHHMYIQTKDSNKGKLVEDFKNHNDSVLLGLKSMFTGIDISGDSLSLVVLCRYPLPRFSVECKQQIAHWRERKFPNWYERESLTVFQQAAGRLIRTTTDRGVVALLDFRANDTSERVHKTAKIGIDAIGSPVTQDINAIRNFFATP